eukprot:5033033-Alexandrium_andersonii.AAC.1
MSPAQPPARPLQPVFHSQVALYRLLAGRERMRRVPPYVCTGRPVVAGSAVGGQEEGSRMAVGA